MRVAKYYKLKRTQAELDFVDVPLHTDLAVFVEPSAIKATDSEWASECEALLQGFFRSVLAAVKANDKPRAVALLSSLRERNEFHLGYSVGRSRGHAFGAGSATSVWTSLLRSKAAKTGVLTDLEDTALLIEGVGPDMISDAVCNIIRGPLIRYTQEMCAYYGIPMNANVASGPMWNLTKDRWESRFEQLPLPRGEKLILVPKVLVRHAATYDVGEYYQHYLLPELQQEHLAAGTALVEVLKNGNRRVTKKKLKQQYGYGKSVVSDLTEKNPRVLQRYKSDKQESPSSPISHQAFSEIENEPATQLSDLLKGVKNLPAGKKHATDYENAVERLLSALFYPSLVYPTRQQRIHQGRKRLDLRFTNVAQSGFFSWLQKHYTAPYIFVECKNYTEEIANPELDQLSGRFSPSRGRVGLLVCRDVNNRKKIEAICRDTVNDERGYIVVLDDEDLESLVQSYAAIHSDGLVRTTLAARFDKLVM